MFSLNLHKKYTWLSLLILVLCTGCGGGGGGGEAEENPSAQIATESAPVGALVALNGYMPLSPGDEWSYDITDGNGNGVTTGKRLVSAISGEDPTSKVKLTEIEGIEESSAITIKKSDGVYTDYTADSEFPSGVAKLLGLVRDYAFPSYAVGEKRTIVRQGTWDEDLDGDGKPETFRIEQHQTYRGIEPVSITWGSIDAARFSTNYTFVVTGSKDKEKIGITANEESYLAQNIGPVKFVRYTEDLDGNVITDQTWTLTSLNVGGKAIDSEGSTHRTIELAHNDLVYDSTRDLYYASIPTGPHANTIATINPDSGVVSYSAPIGAKPNQLSLSADNSFIYVALDDAGQVVKLSLPNFSEVHRITLPTDFFNGMLYATDIAVSPADSNVVAISVSNSYDYGILLYNGTQVATNATTDETTAGYAIAFNNDGSALYAWDNYSLSSNVPLHKIAVASNGLTISDTAAAGYGALGLTQDQNRLYLGSSIHSGTDLSLSHDFQLLHNSCQPMAGTAKIACLSYDFSNKKIAIHNKSNFAKISDLNYSVTFTTITSLNTLRNGMIAFSYSYVPNNSKATGLYLLENVNF